MKQVNTSPLGRILPRRVGPAVDAALGDTRVVLINGARQGGKSTLVRQAGAVREFTWRSLDRPADRRAAADDPSGFVDLAGPMVIDEIQRVPELLLAIKERVDRDASPGQFLLTGSARLLGMRSVPDALPGRMETIELWPFSQGEIDGRPDRFVDAVFALGPDLRHESDLRRIDYAERVVRGGFPEAVARRDPRRRRQFFQSYLADLVNRDVVQISEIERAAEMRAMMRLLAGGSASLTTPAELGARLGVSRDTAQRYVALLEEVFLVKRIPSWSRNISRRAVRTPKTLFVDSGLAGALSNIDASALVRPDATMFGPLLEGFVLSEIARQLTWSESPVELFHYRTKDQVEVDGLLEDASGRVVGIEVKAATTVRSEDFKGLRHLQERVGEDFVAGIVLYTGEATLPFGPRLRAVPVSALWELSGDS